MSGHYPGIAASTNGGQLSSVQGLIVHHTAGGGSPASVAQGMNATHIGTQYLMDRNGTIYKLTPDGTRTNQIKPSWNPAIPWANNGTTEGIELIARNDGDVTQAQVQSLTSFAFWHAQKYGYDPTTHVVGHGLVNGSAGLNGATRPDGREDTEGMTAVNAFESALPGMLSTWKLAGLSYGPGLPSSAGVPGSISDVGGVLTYAPEAGSKNPFDVAKATIGVVDQTPKPPINSMDAATSLAFNLTDPTIMATFSLAPGGGGPAFDAGFSQAAGYNVPLNTEASRDAFMAHPDVAGLNATMGRSVSTALSSVDLARANAQAQAQQLQQTMVPGATGVVSAGNIDLFHRPVVMNPDGTVSTVLSATFTNADGSAVLLPRVSPNGTIMSNDVAMALYKQTGQNLGTFSSEAAANTYAESLHLQQAQYYAGATPTAFSYGVDHQGPSLEDRDAAFTARLINADFSTYNQQSQLSTKSYWDNFYKGIVPIAPLVAAPSPPPPPTPKFTGTPPSNWLAGSDASPLTADQLKSLAAPLRAVDNGPGAYKDSGTYEAGNSQLPAGVRPLSIPYGGAANMSGSPDDRIAPNSSQWAMDAITQMSAMAAVAPKMPAKTGAAPMDWMGGTNLSFLTTPKTTVTPPASRISDIPVGAPYAPYTVSLPPKATLDNPGTILGGVSRNYMNDPSILEPVAQGLRGATNFLTNLPHLSASSDALNGGWGAYVTNAPPSRAPAIPSYSSPPSAWLSGSDMNPKPIGTAPNFGDALHSSGSSAPKSTPESWAAPYIKANIPNITTAPSSNPVSQQFAQAATYKALNADSLPNVPEFIKISQAKQVAYDKPIEQGSAGVNWDPNAMGPGMGNYSLNAPVGKPAVVTAYRTVNQLVTIKNPAYIAQQHQIATAAAQVDGQAHTMVEQAPQRFVAQGTGVELFAQQSQRFNADTNRFDTVTVYRPAASNVPPAQAYAQATGQTYQNPASINNSDNNRSLTEGGFNG